MKYKASWPYVSDRFSKKSYSYTNIYWRKIANLDKKFEIDPDTFDTG